MMKRCGVVGIVGAVLVACAAAGVHAAGGEPGVADRTPYTAERLRPYVEAWQGVWVVKGGMMSRLVAWRIEGDDVTVFNGRRTYEGRFEVVAPCKLQIVTDNARTLYPFAIGAEKRYAGLGDAGVVADQGIVACADHSLYVVRDGACRVWDKRFGEWELRDPGRVTSADSCTHGDGYLEAGDVRLEETDGVLLDDTMRDAPVRRVDTFEEARERVRNQ